jgi:hypothetical protein
MLFTELPLDIFYVLWALEEYLVDDIAELALGSCFFALLCYWGVTYLDSILLGFFLADSALC